MRELTIRCLPIHTEREDMKHMNAASAPDQGEITELMEALNALVSTPQFDRYKAAVKAAHSTALPTSRGAAAKRKSTYNASEVGNIPGAGGNRKQKKSRKAL
jgi:hypothetical protein